MSKYEFVAGIETHVQLKTQTKLFCGCSTTFGAPPNSQVCPVCLGHPGTLPVLNRKAFELAMSAALMLHCTLAPKTKFDRKHYFYPDLPKGYQISQYDMPLAQEGSVELTRKKSIRLIRVHVEEDAGKLIHKDEEDQSLVDLNRAGIPLIEIVTYPDFRSADEVYDYLTHLKQILQYSEVSECDMEKGELRCDANLSLRPKGEKKLGVKTEIKNLNSFRNIKEALTYEYERQKKILSEGGVVKQETRSFDPEKKVTSLMRSKEDAHDYRYFPEPDLVPIEISEEWKSALQKELSELPAPRRDRFIKEFALSEYDAGVLTGSREIADYYEACIRLYKHPKKIANWISNDLMNIVHEEKLDLGSFSLSPKHFVALIKLVDEKKITASVAKDLLPDLIQNPRSPEKAVEEKGLSQIDDASAIDILAKKVCEENPQIVADFKGGKESAIKALIGRIMKETKGRANPKLADQALRKALKA